MSLQFTLQISQFSTQNYQDDGLHKLMLDVVLALKRAETGQWHDTTFHLHLHYILYTCTINTVLHQSMHYLQPILDFFGILLALLLATTHHLLTPLHPPLHRQWMTIPLVGRGLSHTAAYATVFRVPGPPSLHVLVHVCFMECNARSTKYQGHISHALALLQVSFVRLLV